jgi:hypothetical protein
MRLTVRRCIPVVMAFVVIVAACGGGESTGGDAWGGEASGYFDELAGAYSDNDYYGILDFYSVEASVEIWRGDNRGGMLVRNFIKWNSGDLGETVRATYLGRNASLTLVEWETSGGLSAIVGDIRDGLITHEVVYDQAVWLGQGLRSSSESVAEYEDLYERFAEVWNGDGTAALADLYHPNVTIHDPLNVADTRGLDRLEATRDWVESIETMPLSSVTVTGPRTGPAVFPGPSPFGTDPERAVGLYQVTYSRDCVGELAVVWTLAEGLVVDEVRLWGVGSFAECHRAMPEGWWSGLSLPGPSDERVTGVIEAADGHEIAVHNGTPLLEGLITAGLARFSVANLEQPRFDSVTFEPSRNCETRSGRLLQENGSRDIFMCLYESDVCPGGGECVEPPLNVRGNVLHELGHAWILDNVDSTEQERLLEVSGREVWQSADVPWSERGVEYAAEVIAWGLLDETEPMVRIGRPSCDELEMAYEALTGTTPALRDDACVAG